MTNADKIAEIFPDGICPFSESWLRSEYKEPPKIKIGDEVFFLDKDYRSVVTAVDDDQIVYLTQTGKWGVYNGMFDERIIHKTGKHYPEIAEILHKLRGEGDGLSGI